MSAPRSIALDAMRGATVALMILVNNPGSWNHIYPPFAHAEWHGVTPTDLVFPFFLFVVGASMAFALPGESSARDFWPRVLQRAALIFAIGLFLNATPFVRWNEAGELVAREMERLRVMGVLQRIALAYLGAAVIVRLFGERHAWAAAALLLLAYWGACVGFAQGADPYSLEGFFGTALDRAWLGPAHLYRGEGAPFDPEGLASTVPCVAQVLLGFTAGRWLKRGPIDAALVSRLFVTAALLTVLAYAWQLAMPMNKKLWTSSYVVFTTGLALATLASLVHALDLRAWRGPLVRSAVAFGRNALFVFVLSGFLPRVLALVRWKDGPAWTSPLPWVYEHGFAMLPGDPRAGSLAYAVALLAAYAALVLWMDRRRWYVRV
jgi:predicted acyltransferase